MKITKTILRQIIKEELIKENFDGLTGLPTTPEGMKMCKDNKKCKEKLELVLFYLSSENKAQSLIKLDKASDKSQQNPKSAGEEPSATKSIDTFEHLSDNQLIKRFMKVKDEYKKNSNPNKQSEFRSELDKIVAAVKMRRGEKSK